VRRECKTGWRALSTPHAVVGAAAEIVDGGCRGGVVDVEGFRGRDAAHLWEVGVTDRAAAVAERS